MITQPNQTGRHRSRTLAVLATACALVLLAVGGACATRAPDAVAVGSGRIEFADGSSIAFDEILELAFQPDVESEADTVVLNRWPLVYSPSTPARSIPLAWVATLDFTEYETDSGCRCMRDVTIDVRTDNGVEFRTRARTLEWVSVRAAGNADSGEESRQVYFAGADGLHVRRIVFE